MMPGNMRLDAYFRLFLSVFLSSYRISGSRNDYDAYMSRLALYLLVFWQHGLRL
jgi:hypothetical protein